MSTQHITTLLGATCWVRLATVLRRVATCWMLLAQIWKWSNFSCNICGCRMMLWLLGQVRPTMLCLGMRISSIFNPQQVATRRNREAKRTQQGDQTDATCCSWQCCYVFRSNVGIVWTELEIGGLKTLGYLALRCCYRLAGLKNNNANSEIRFAEQGISQWPAEPS